MKRIISYLLLVVFVCMYVGSLLPVNAYSASNAEAVANAFMQTYWDSDAKYFYCNSNRQINENHNPGPQNGLYADYWWEAQLWETVMDIYERTDSATYRTMIGDVYDGFLAAYPDWSENSFNDDIGWWALACLRAYDITSETRYLNTAKQMFDFIYTQYSSDYGGGIWWNRINFLTQKNVATNATASIIAAKLSNALDDSSYMQKAVQLYTWVKTTFYDGSTGFVGDNISGEGNGTVATWEYTYNFGQFADASYELYLATQEEQYLSDAYKAIDWVLDKMTNDGILIYEGEDDCPAFKMIFSRTVAQIGYGENKTEYIQSLQRNATQAYNHRRTDGLIGPDFSTTPDADASIQVIAAAAGVSIMYLTQPDNYTGNINSGRIFEAENARRYSIDNEKANSGFSGRGYTAGWNNQNTSIVFEYNAPSAGQYRLSFHYAAAAGDATRSIYINGSLVNNAVTFHGTTGWSAWSDITLTVPLIAGRNEIKLAMQPINQNYLNLDYMTVDQVVTARLEAENGLLNGISTESSQNGYSGTGYTAGWNDPGTSVTLSYNAPYAGQYRLSLRYAAAAGNATRNIRVNGALIQYSTAFPGTNAWDAWNEVDILVPMVMGQNSIEIMQQATDGNYLNLDYAEVEMVEVLTVEAENGALHSLSTESTSEGYSGTGYIAGWNSDGQYVDLHPTVAQSGYYTLTFRYAVGNGSAVRQLYINGTTVASELTFPGGNIWNNYYTVEVQNVYLNQGENTISLIYASGLNSSNWLNFDCLMIS